ncbi:MAG: histidine--tRNA ligase [Candidatus Aenigmarchaeota archaeon]|nr:histidine--tRNA ligase [Candidatus Aenigmarchaeota archaeon]
MAEVKLMNAKGVRDFLPEEKIPRQRIVDTLKGIFEMYGFSPIETPSIERLDVLAAKFAGGEEILKEIFKFNDQGDRKLGLIYDLTVPMCKVVGMNPNLPRPFRRYQIQPVWRDGPIKLGRYREFLQCDVDIVGVKSMVADAEILSIVDRAFRGMKMDFVIRVNNRKLLNGIMDYAGFGEYKMKAILAIDKLAKIGAEGVKEELLTLGFEKKEVDNVLKILRIKGKNPEVLSQVKKFVKSDEGMEGIKELEELIGYCKKMEVKSIEIDLSLARGLEYYTGPVFEVYLKNSKINSSLAGGGRYDKMIGMYLGKGEYPATGVSFGIEPIFEALKLEKKTGESRTVSRILVIPIGDTFEKALPIVEKIRDQGIPCEIDIMGRGISKNLSYANSLGIPYVIFLGEKELKEKKVKLRDMKSGKEEMLTIEKVVEKLKQ